MKKKNAFYDLYVEATPENLDETIEIARKLGWKGLGIVAEESNMKMLREKIRKKGQDMDISVGIKIDSKKASEIPRQAKKLRKRAELITVMGGNPEVNRAAVETPEVDILLSPWSEEGCGINHVIARLGKKNDVAIAFGFSELVYSYKKTRVRLLSGIEEAARIVKRFRCPFILSGTAASPWDLRSPSEIVSFGRMLGFGDTDIGKAMSNDIVKENRKRLYGKWVMPGVEVV